MTRELIRSADLFERVRRVVPGGIYGHMSPAFLAPGEYPNHNWFLATSHGDAELEATLEATKAAFEVVAQKFGA